ncbi:MAG TPA: hypothetical protein VEW93_04865 [Acidimicrobiales bacterium]|nr:hypothetical protein [Acidimicrobiales bacterium]
MLAAGISWPDWISAVGTVGALVSTLYLVRRDRREAMRQEVEEQARQVSAWYEMKAPAHGTVAVIVGHVVNRSIDPVFNVAVRGARSDAEPDWSASVLVPAGEVEFKIHGVPVTELDAELHAHLTFTDARGVSWARGGADLRRVAST